MAAIDSTAVELNIGEEKIAFLVIKAREFDMKVEPSDASSESGSDGTDDGEREILEDIDGDLTETELRDAIEGLGEDELLDVIAMVWVGRGDYDKAEWSDARNLARERHITNAADYLTGIPMLGDFIEEGYAALGYSTSDTDLAHL